MREKRPLKKNIAGLILLCFSFLPVHSQDRSFDRDDITFKRQWKFSLAGLVYQNLKLTHDGPKHLKSLPALSGEFTVSYYTHLMNGYGLVIGAGVNVAPYYMHYNFEAPENSIFRTNDFYDYEYLDLFNMEYEDGLLLVAPISVHKWIPRSGKTDYSVELGVKFNVQNIDPDYLPYIWESGDTYFVDDSRFDEGDNKGTARAFQSVIETNGGILAVSCFLKAGWIRVLKNQRTFEYRAVMNWSPKKIRTGTYQFYNLGYESSGTIEQRINYVGFEVVYGFTTQRRLKGD